MGRRCYLAYQSRGPAFQVDCISHTFHVTHLPAIAVVAFPDFCVCLFDLMLYLAQNFKSILGSLEEAREESIGLNILRLGLL